MSADGQLIQLAEQCAVAAVAAAYPFAGLGPAVKSLLDDHAAQAVQRVLVNSPLLPRLAIATCEGARDGALVVDFAAAQGAEAYLYCDPIDGTLNAVRGGPRSYSVVAFGRRPPLPWVKALDDSAAVFVIGSQRDDVSAVFASDGDWYSVVRDAVRSRHEMSATLNRSDNLRLLLDLSGLTLTDFTVGSRAGYRPTLRGPACIAVGDATATLPFECALEFGRIGLTEAQIQSGLYRSWTGLIVSRQRIQQSEGGTIEYLNRYLAARRCEDPAMLATFFTDRELRRLAAAGSDLMAVTAPLDQASFGIGTDGITVLAALCTDLDPWLADTGGILASPKWRAGESKLEVDALVVSGGTADRRILAAAPLQNPGLPAALRHWYRTFDWPTVEDQRASSEPWLAGIGEIAEGSNVRAAAGDVHVVSQKEI